MPLGGGQPGKNKPYKATRDNLKNAVANWERMVEKVRDLRANLQNEIDTIEDAIQAGTMRPDKDPEDYPDIQRLKQELAEAREARDRVERGVIRIVSNNPDFHDEAVKFGFDEALLPTAQPGTTPAAAEGGGGVSGGGTQGPPSGGGDAVDQIAAQDQGFRPGGTGRGGGSGGGQAADSLRQMAQDNRLLGTKGKDYTVKRGPSGMFYAVYAYRVEGEVIKVALKLGKDPDKLARYGISPGDAKSITSTEVKQRLRSGMKNLQVIGWADELAPHIRKGDSDVFDSLVRYLENQYEGQPILRNKGVMGKIIANSMFGWTAGEFENQLRNTQWYKNTNDHQRTWQTVWSDKEKRDVISSTRQQVINALETHYGFDYLKHIEGGIEKINQWAEQIASGRWGTPTEGLKFWGERQFDRAAKIDGTPAWMQNQQAAEALAGFANRPEDQRELLRAQARAYLGPRGVPDNATLMQWATDLVTETKSDADWMRYLRNQSEALHPWKDKDTPWQDFASSYKATAERLIGSPIEWDDPLLANLQATKEDGSALNQPLAQYDFEQSIRDNDSRFWENPDTESRGLTFLSELSFRMSGVR